MSIHAHLQKLHKTQNLSLVPNYKGSLYDYSQTIKYYPKVYFSGNTSTELADWLEEHFHAYDEMFKIPENHCDATWEISKTLFKDIPDKKLQEIVEDAIRRGLAYNTAETIQFIKDAVACETDDDTIFIELW